MAQICITSFLNMLGDMRSSEGLSLQYAEVKASICKSTLYKLQLYHVR